MAGAGAVLRRTLLQTRRQGASTIYTESSGDAAGCLRGQLRFLEDSHFFGDGLRLSQYTLIEQPGDRLDHCTASAAGGGGGGGGGGGATSSVVSIAFGNACV